MVQRLTLEEARTPSSAGARRAEGAPRWRRRVAALDAARRARGAPPPPPRSRTRSRRAARRTTGQEPSVRVEEGRGASPPFFHRETKTTHRAAQYEAWRRARARRGADARRAAEGAPPRVGPVRVRVAVRGRVRGGAPRQTVTDERRSRTRRRRLRGGAATGGAGGRVRGVPRSSCGPHREARSPPARCRHGAARCCGAGGVETQRQMRELDAFEARVVFRENDLAGGWWTAGCCAKTRARRGGAEMSAARRRDPQASMVRARAAVTPGWRSRTDAASGPTRARRRATRNRTAREPGGVTRGSREREREADFGFVFRRRVPSHVILLPGSRSGLRVYRARARPLTQ